MFNLDDLAINESLHPNGEIQLFVGDFEDEANLAGGAEEFTGRERVIFTLETWDQLRSLLAAPAPPGFIIVHKTEPWVQPGEWHYDGPVIVNINNIKEIWKGID